MINRAIDCFGDAMVQRIIGKAYRVGKCAIGCVVHYGRDYHGGVGLFLSYVFNTTIEHNRVFHGPYSGISLGWGWTLEETSVRNNLVRYNDVHDVVELMDDGACLYTLLSADVTLQSSNDGETWTELDRRTDIKWAYQTNRRSFEVSSPGYYSRYRLVVNRTVDPDRNRVQISMLELLDVAEQDDGAKVGIPPV